MKTKFNHDQHYFSERQFAQLSGRETQILKLISREFTTMEIATKLCLSPETIRSHRRQILNKLSARNVAGMIRRAFEVGLLDPIPQH